MYLEPEKESEMVSNKRLIDITHPDDDYWEDFESLNVMATMNDEKLLGKARKDDAFRSKVLQDIISKQILNRPETQKLLCERINNLDLAN